MYNNKSDNLDEMDKLLGTLKSTKTESRKEDGNKPMTKETESAIKNLPMKSPESDGF